MPKDIPINIPERCSEMGRRHCMALQGVLGKESRDRARDTDYSMVYGRGGQPQHGRTTWG